MRALRRHCLCHSNPFPVFRVTGNQLLLATDDPCFDAGREPFAGADNRLGFDAGDEWENLWVAGVTAHLAIPISNAVYLATRQAALIARLCHVE